MTALPFRDREDAARQLATALSRYRGTRPLILAIPRGAVPIGRILADALEGDLDVVLVRKLGAPGNPELAIGAIDERGAVYLNDYARRAGADDEYLRAEIAAQAAVIAEHRRRFGRGHAPRSIADRTVVVVDDGLATGSTMSVALRAVRAQMPRHLVCAVPVASAVGIHGASELADDTVCLATPSPFHAVGLYYLRFDPVSESDVVHALERRGPDTVVEHRDVSIETRMVALAGTLSVPADAQGMVVFVHGSGSSRHSPRNRFVARVLQQRGIATLLMDLLTDEEDADIASRFDIALLASRVQDALGWLAQQADVAELPVGLFGSSTGAAAALLAAADPRNEVVAVVSRGGRPDLAEQALAELRVPTLLIVGSADTHVLALNRAACDRLGSWCTLEVVPGAGHLFEEEGTLAEMADHAAEWFERHFASEQPKILQLG